jgi:phosphohistidine swiveling domain-containing protein
VKQRETQLNRIRNHFRREVEQLLPVLHETYRRVGVYQKRRAARDAQRLLAQLDVVAPLLEFFRPYVPGPKRGYFRALADRSLGVSDRIVALDVAVGSMHIAFRVPRAYMHRHSRRLLDVLEAARLCEQDAESARANAAPKALVLGIGASPGVAAGPAHVALRTSALRRLPTGSILVTTMTRPEVITTVGRAAAIVTDQGGSLCHAAIIARELHLPCVVGASDATRRIRTGWTIRVDGSAGAVTRIDQHSKGTEDGS